jgi:hypothetical protein
MVINGIGKFICSMAVPARPVECDDTLEKQMLGLLSREFIGVPTRLRLVNVGYDLKRMLPVSC